MFKKDDQVEDTWFSYWGIGIVYAVLKTRIKINFSGEILTYDNAHAKRFLRKID